MWDDAIDDASDEFKQIVHKYAPSRLTTVEEAVPFEVDALGEEVEPVTLERTDGKPVAVINLDGLTDDELETIIEHAHENDNIVSPGTREDLSLLSAALSDGDVQDILDYFSEYLTENDTKLLSRCLTIREDWEGPEYTTRKEMKDRRGDLAKDSNFGDEAKLVSNLCTAGYYDEEGYLRTLFSKVDSFALESPQQRLYNQILAREPFTIFVSEEDTPHSVTKDLIDKFDDIDSYMIDFDFIDARALGGDNRDTLERAILNLHKASKRLQYQADVGERETAYRLNPDSFSKHPDESE